MDRELQGRKLLRLLRSIVWRRCGAEERGTERGQVSGRLTVGPAGLEPTEDGEPDETGYGQQGIIGIPIERLTGEIRE